METRVSRQHIGLLFIFLAFFIWSGTKPRDYFTWVLEVLPAVIGLAVIIITYTRFRLTNLVYLLICIHAIILVVGGHYTYAEMPVFNWIRDEFGLSRNYYDRLGHLAQGFIPALIVREVLLRKTALHRGKMLFFLVVSVCLAVSAFYEFVEWWVAAGSGQAADAFLGTQGDVWDTQWDMFMAFCGAIISQLLLGRQHDNQLLYKQHNDSDRD